MEAQINFYNTEKFDLQLQNNVKVWLSQIIGDHGFNYSEINYTFLADEALLDINKKYLKHDFYTDIITFDNTIQKTISADIMISVGRVKDNALAEDVEFEYELLRVMVHGVLHCIGFNDDTEEAKSLMRKKEDEALEMFHVEHNMKKNNV